MHATALHAGGAHGVIVVARNRGGHLGRGQDEQEVPAESWRTAPHPASLSTAQGGACLKCRAEGCSRQNAFSHNCTEKACRANCCMGSQKKKNNAAAGKLCALLLPHQLDKPKQSQVVHTLACLTFS